MKLSVRYSLLAALIASSLSPAWAGTAQLNNAEHNEKPLWLRNTALSPDGKQLAFTYQSHIYLASSNGGNARAITNGEFYPHNLVWSPDNSTLAFAANPYGNDDVFTVSLATGKMTRLTYHSAADIPTAFSDNGETVLFNTTRLTAGNQDFYSLPEYAFGTEGNQLYSVDVKTGAAHALLPVPAKNAVWNSQKTQLLYNSPHKDQQFRKHQQSFAVPTIWLYDTTTGKHKQLTENKVASQEPQWNHDDSGFYYLGERNGSFNVWFYDLKSGKNTQITTLADHPVRHLSVARNGDLAFSYNGELYRLAQGQTTPEKLSVSLNNYAVKPSQYFRSDTATDFMPSAFDADEVLFTSYGDIYAMNARSKKAKRLTHTATEEKQMTFTPDGYGVMYVAMRDGRWGLYTASSLNEEEMLSHTPVVNEEPFLVLPDHHVSQPVFSPDGNKLAFVIDGRALHVLDLDSYNSEEPISSWLDKIPSLLSTDNHANTENSDTGTKRPNLGKELIAAEMVSESNRLEFVWSPDSTQLAVHLSPRPYVEQIYVVDAEGKKPAVNVSQSGFYNGMPKWSQDNRILTWTTSRSGLKTADGEDWDETVTGIFTNSAAMRDFKDDAELPEEVKNYPFSAKNIEYREAFHLPFSTRVLETHLLGDELLVIDLVPSPSGEESTRGFIYNLRTEESYPVFADQPAAIGAHVTADQNYVYLLQEGEVVEIDTATGEPTSLPIDLPVDYQEVPRKLAAYQQFVRQTKDLYYRPDMGNVDWTFYSKNYQRFLPHINNNRDFANLLKELSGELNASHTGAFTEPAFTMREDATAELGLIFEQHIAALPSEKGNNWHAQNGLVIHDILPGGPADSDEYELQPGDRLVAVNNIPVQTLADLAAVLNNKAEEAVELTLQRGSENSWQQRITPIDSYDAYSLILKRWEIARREYVSQKTNGKVGYVYLPDMSNPSFEHLRSEALGRLRNAEALIIDVRFNGGGFLADTLIEFLTARKVADIIPHVGKPTSDASRRSWLKPSVVIANSASYSEASAFSQYYRDLKVGPIVGEPVPGTGTTVMGVESQVYQGVGYMFPYQPLRTVDGKFYENLELQPDVKVFNTPSDIAAGKDRQLDAAIDEALKQI